LKTDIHALYLFDPRTLRPVEIHLRHLPDSFVLEYEQLKRDGERGYERLVRTGRVISDTIVYPGGEWKRSLLYRLNKKYRMRHYLCAPILSGGQLVGMLALGRGSEGASFNRRDGRHAEEVCRILSARLSEIPGLKAETPSSTEISVEHFARLRAERALLRSCLDQLEDEAAPLPPATAVDYWGALSQNRSTPLDFFDHKGRRYVLLPFEIADLSAKRTETLTRREHEVILRVAAGETNKAVAFDLGISGSTVANHLSSAMDKLGFKSRVRLIEGVRNWGLMAPSSATSPDNPDKRKLASRL